ncbi:DUF4115 domain-containing protein [Neisseriaceae bacterium TC5R-5]|nr:DUF4115 domain-containing protein [Neisseriaceae bacterium TC5R-5]
MESSFEPTSSPLTIGVGAQLKAAREAVGLSLGEVADRLKFSIRQLEAIERDDFSILPGATFVRGFVRNYACFLRLDPAPLMALLEQQFPSAVNDVANLVRDGIHDHEQAFPLGGAGNSGRSGRWVGLLLLLVAVGGGVAWLANGNIALEFPSSVSVSSSAPLAQQDKDIVNNTASSAVASAPLGQLVTSVASKLPVSSVPVVQSAAVVPSAPASAPVANVAIGRVLLSVKDEASWVSMIDASGEKLVYGTLSPGTSKEAVGTPPFTLIIGNASQVTVNFNGQAVDFSDKVRGATAKIYLK